MSDRGLTVQANEKENSHVWYECRDCRIKFAYPRHVEVEFCPDCGSDDVDETEAKPSLDSPKGLGVQPDIKEKFKHACEHLKSVTELYFAKHGSDPVVDDLWNEMYRAIVWLDWNGRDLDRLTLTDDCVTKKATIGADFASGPDESIVSLKHSAFIAMKNRMKELELDLTGKNVEIECLKINVEALEKQNSSLKVANAGHANSVLSIHSEELSELKAEVERWKERYRKLSSSPSDFQVIEHLTERCERYEKALKDAHQTIRDRIKSPRDGWETHLGALEYRLNELLAPKKEGA